MITNAGESLSMIGQWYFYFGPTFPHINFEFYRKGKKILRLIVCVQFQTPLLNLPYKISLWDDKYTRSGHTSL